MMFLEHDVVGDVGRQLYGGAGDCAVAMATASLGGLLADDVLVEFGDDFARRQLVEREVLFFGGCG